MLSTVLYRVAQMVGGGLLLLVGIDILLDGRTSVRVAGGELYFGRWALPVAVIFFAAAAYIVWMAGYSLYNVLRK